VAQTSATHEETAARLFDVRGARTIVTGGASGLGLAMAEVMADCGARVTIADIDADRLDEVTASLAGRGRDVRSFVCDVSDSASVKALFADVITAQGGVDVAFANAGIAAIPGFGVAGGQTLDTVGEEWDRVLGINLNGVLYTMREAAGVMKRQRSGRIIVTASNAGIAPEPLVCYGYIAAKAAVINVVRQAALELAPYGVNVNAIAPGPFKTRIAGGVDEEGERTWSALVAMGRMGDTEELKGLALLLASPAASFITGTTTVIDGGMLLGSAAA
jgi:NAD(P)-dependent dehydrogenase (short-subunit alcohol dehydrogenase family)